MDIRITVNALADVQDIMLNKLVVVHEGCHGALQHKRDPLLDRYSLRCLCGLVLEFPVSGIASQYLARAAISQESAALPGTEFSCGNQDKVIIAGML